MGRNVEEQYVTRQEQAWRLENERVRSDGRYVRYSTIGGFLLLLLGFGLMGLVVCVMVSPLGSGDAVTGDGWIAFLASFESLMLSVGAFTWGVYILTRDQER